MSKKAVSKSERKIGKSVTLPEDLLRKVEAKIATMPETDFSKYVRNLIRRDMTKAA